ncbi:hypothetical protein M407DRAFT_241639 [Tulasnella calospora MUT 4182]|uniref:Uncharacterized protein n=1 Tax=Tulasnella calospora MUT 4182 TaxID=1051891 RepID=A0A0C3QSH3_9AGAM|nr:hypothetical protein M407DRAFT_241639 [Tulasnella calospora MUT 4182]
MKPHSLAPGPGPQQVSAKARETSQPGIQVPVPTYQRREQQGDTKTNSEGKGGRVCC